MTADPIAGIIYPVRSVAPDITATMQPTVDAIGALLGPAGAGFVRTREIPVTMSGTLATALDIAAAQTVAASPFGAGSYSLRISASMGVVIPAAAGAQLDIMLDGVVIATNMVTNSGGGGDTQTVSSNRTVTISDTAAHIIRAVISPLTTSITLHADATRYFEIQAFPRKVLS